MRSKEAGSYMKHTLALVLMVLGLVGCSSTTFNPSADHWVSMPSTSLCFTYYSNYGVARDKTWRLTNYNRIINEIDRRGISCKTFAKASDKDWMRDWVNKNSNPYSSRLKYERDWEEHSQKVLKEERLAKNELRQAQNKRTREINLKNKLAREKRLAKESAIKEEEEKKRIIIGLTQRCEEYGFTGESNISACIQREAQHDKELAMQKYELQKTRVALQQAQSQAQSRAYAQSLPPVVEEEEKVPWLIKFLGDVAIGVAEGYEHQATHPAPPAPKQDIYRNCRPNC